MASERKINPQLGLPRIDCGMLYRADDIVQPANKSALLVKEKAGIDGNDVIAVWKFLPSDPVHDR